MTIPIVPSLTEELLTELGQLAGKATPGPWTSGEPIIGVRRFIVADICGRMVYPATNKITHGTSAVDDADYIAAANPDTILAMLAERADLKRQLAASSIDADRYRWLRSPDAWNGFQLVMENGGDNLDAAIDKAKGIAKASQAEP